MTVRNMVILEATESISSAPSIIAALKKQLTTCKLTRYKSAAACDAFYSGFFLCNADVNAGTDDGVAFVDWCMVYNNLLSDDKFRANLCDFMAMYQPAEYTGMWNPLIHQIDFELSHIKEHRLGYLGEAKAFFKAMQRELDGLGEVIKAEVNDPSAIKFITTVNMVLGAHITYIARLIEHETAETDPDDIIISQSIMPLEEDVVEILAMVENADAEITKLIGPIDEAVISNAVMKAKSLKVKADRAQRMFDELVMKQVKAAREKRRNRKHAEMVGEALRINNEVKRLLVSGGLGMLNPALGVIFWVTSVVVNRQTDKRDREILVGQIKDELEIIEEKIQIAERNGDDKAKIELIRIRQRLQKEYGRIQRYRWDPDRANTNRG